MTCKVFILVCGILVVGCSSSHNRNSSHTKLLSTIKFYHDEFRENFDKGKALVFLNEQLYKHQSGSSKLLINIDKSLETSGYGVKENTDNPFRERENVDCNHGVPKIPPLGDFYIDVIDALNFFCDITGSGWRVEDDEIIIFSRRQDSEWVSRSSDFMEGVEP